MASQTRHIRCVLSPASRDHKTGAHPESPARYDAVLRAVEPSGCEQVQAPRASREQVEAVHDPRLVEGLFALAAAGGGAVDPDTVVSPGSFEAALFACGGAIAAADAVLDGEAGAAFSVARPPGHHADRGRAMGFCLLNQVAVAAAHARSRGAERVAILDWDVHHGNGTEAIFWRSPDVLYVSLHQYGWGFFPGTGPAGDRGGGEGEGATLNIPLDAGTGSEQYLDAFHRLALPAVRAHRPDLVLVSAGYDAHAADPIGELRLAEADFAEMTGALADLGAPLALVLEGGYDLGALERSAAATLAALTSR